MVPEEAASNQVLSPAQQKLAERRLEVEAKRERAREKRRNANDRRSFRYSTHFRDALRGEHSYTEPALTDEEYMARWEGLSAPAEMTVARLCDEAAQLPVPAGQRWFRPRSDLRIGLIADAFLTASLMGTAELVPLTPTGWREELPSLDLLLVTSAWRGQNGEWFELSLPGSARRRQVSDEIMPTARRAGIPVVYYSKEDPPNFEQFASLAKSADFVFTTAVEVIPKYEAIGPKEVPVGVLPFGANPLVHSPLGSMRHAGREIAFAGSWHSHKYFERRRAGGNIFEGLLRAGGELILFDRNLELGQQKYRFPEQFIRSLHKPIAHSDLMRLQRLLPVAVNLNSVVGSQTMFANRAIELQAMGTQIVSNYSAGLNTQFPHIAMPDSLRDAESFFAQLTDADIRRAQIEGIRAAFAGNTAFDRVQSLLTAVGLDDSSTTAPAVRIGGISESDFKAFADSQTADFPLTWAGEDASGAAWDVDSVVVAVDPSQRHHRHFVQDLVNGFRIADVDSVRIAGGSETAFEVSTSGDSHGEIRESAWWVPAGAGAEHARTSAASTLLVGELPVREAVLSRRADARRRELSVVVPVYNNGTHLRHKCIASLKRSSIFERMHVILVDDGSTDPETREIVNDLEREHGNITAYRFPEGGSGSASRPRNKGLELVDTPWVTYLDPDNEALNDGYAMLLEKVREDDLDFAIGNVVKLRHNRTIVLNHEVLKKHIVDSIPSQTILADVNFQPMSIQALVADTAWLRGLGLEQPVGAVGQDSFFFQQMLYYARRIGTVKTPIHAYFAAVANSTVNAISPRFYEKYLPLEPVRAEWLREIGLLDDYFENRLPAFTRGWYLGKLTTAAPEDIPTCIALIRRIVGYYGPTDWIEPELEARLELSRSAFVQGHAAS